MKESKWEHWVLLVPVAMPDGHEQSESKSGFAGILSGLTKKEPLNSDVELKMKNDGQQLSNEELRELVQSNQLSRFNRN